MKIVGIFQVWRYLKADRRNKDVERIEISKLCHEWDFYESILTFLVQPGSRGDVKEGRE